MLQYPNIDPVIFRIGPIAPRWYGMVYLTSFLFLYYWMRREWRWLGVKTIEEIDSVLGTLILAMICGARFTYVFVYNWEYTKNQAWWEIFAVWHGGLSFHGGIIGVILGSFWVARVHKLQVLRLWDIILLATPLAVGFGRIANFINGELWGRVSDVPWAIIFPGAGNEPRHPSQIYESFFEGFLFFLVVWILWKRKVKHGVIAGVFGIWYAFARFFCERFREPDQQVGFLWGGFTMGQILSVLLLVMGIAVLTFSLRRKMSPEEAKALAARGN